MLQRRFGPRVKTLSALIFLITRSLADGIRLFTTALVISVVTQISVSVLVVVLAAAMIVYTMRGGVSAVIWTDVVQMFVYVAGAGLIAWSLLGAIDGGWQTVLNVGREAGRFTVLDWSLDPTRAYTLWAGLFGGVALTLSTHGTDQFLVQRLLSARSAREASTGLVLSGFIVFAQFVLFLLIGVMLYAYYLQTPLPQPLSRTDEVLPLFVVTVAALRARRLHRGGHRRRRAVAVVERDGGHHRDDFYTPYVNPGADEATRMRVSKLATAGWGIVQLGVALGAQFMARSVLDAGLSVLSLGIGPGARRVPARDPVPLHARARRVRRHGCRPDGDGRRLVGHADCLHLVRADWRDDDDGGRVAVAGDDGGTAHGGGAVTLALDRTREVLLEAVANRVFPGAVVEVGGVARAAATIAVGTLGYEEGSDAVSDSTIFDLASLTKVLSTATLAATLVEHGMIALDDPVRKWSTAWQGEDRRGVSIRHLLLHASGLPAHRRYFETISGGPAFEAAICQRAPRVRPGRGERLLRSRVHPSRTRARTRRRRGLDAQFDAWRRSTWTAEPAIRFRPPAAWLPRIAPTEDDPWRGRVLRGEVHDENAAALDGVAGHAGLFGTAAAVGDCARWWMARASREPWATFLARGNVPGSSRALGWDTMRTTSSCGTRMSSTAAGHTGFTGTSLWIDCESDRYVVFLSNRVHPSRAGDAMARVRPALHDAVAGDLTRG